MKMVKVKADQRLIHASSPQKKKESILVDAFNWTMYITTLAVL